MKLSYDLNNIYYWANKYKSIYIAIIWIILLVLAYVFIILSLQHQRSTALEQQNKLTIELTTQIKAKEILLNNISKLNLFVKTLQQWQEKFVSNTQKGTILQQLVNLVRHNNLINQQFDPWDEVNAQFGYRKTEIKLNLRGTFIQLGSFMDQVIHMPYLIVIEKFAIKLAPDANKTISGCTLKENCLRDLDLILAIYSK